MKILVVAPHADDEVLGAGGVIQLHIQRNDTVFVVVVANRVIGHKIDEKYVAHTKRNAQEVKKMLGIEKYFFCGLADEHLDESLINVIMAIEEVVNEVIPDIAYIPNETDTNQDHRAVYQACLVACRNIDKVLAYEVPSETKNFEPNFYAELEEEFLANKIKAMQYYESEIRKYPNPRSEEGLRIFAQMRGMECNRKLAEAFILIKGVV